LSQLALCDIVLLVLMLLQGLGVGKVLDDGKLLVWLVVLWEDLLVARLLLLAQRGLPEEWVLRPEVLQVARVQLELLLLDLLLLAHLVEEAEMAELVGHAVILLRIGPVLSHPCASGVCRDRARLLQLVDLTELELLLKLEHLLHVHLAWLSLADQIELVQLVVQAVVLDLLVVLLLVELLDQRGGRLLVVEGRTMRRGHARVGAQVQRGLLMLLLLLLIQELYGSVEKLHLLLSVRLAGLGVLLIYL